MCNAAVLPLGLQSGILERLFLHDCLKHTWVYLTHSVDSPFGSDGEEIGRYLNDRQFVPLNGFRRRLAVIQSLNLLERRPQSRLTVLYRYDTLCDLEFVECFLK